MPRTKKVVAKATAEKVVKVKKEEKKEEVVKGKKPIAFEIPSENKEAIEKAFEVLQEKFNDFGEELNTYVYDGKKKAAASSRAFLMEIIKTSKELRNHIQESKVVLKPIYK